MVAPDVVANFVGPSGGVLCDGVFGVSPEVAVPPEGGSRPSYPSDTTPAPAALEAVRHDHDEIVRSTEIFRDTIPVQIGEDKFAGLLQAYANNVGVDARLLGGLVLSRGEGEDLRNVVMLNRHLIEGLYLIKLRDVCHDLHKVELKGAHAVRVVVGVVPLLFPHVPRLENVVKALVAEIGVGLVLKTRHDDDVLLRS